MNEPKRMSESDILVPALIEYLDFCKQLAGLRNYAFANEMARKSLQVLGHTGAKRTLEVAIALAEAHSVNGKLEQLPDVVAQVYALTPERARDLRLQFLNEIKSSPTMDMGAIDARAKSYYVPTHGEICEYVAGLPKEGRSLIARSETEQWESLATQYGSRFRDQIAHFTQLEKRFTFRLCEYLPPTRPSD